MPGWALHKGLLITCSAGLAALAALLLAPGAAAATGGPDGCGYTWIDSASAGGPAYDFVDISTTGSATGLPHGDDTAYDVTLPFPFTFCNVTYTTIRTSSNGYVCFIDANSDCGSGGSPGWTPYAYSGSPSIPSPGGNPPWPAVFAYFADLYAMHCSSAAPTSCTSYEVTGASPNRVFIYMEKNVAYCCSATPLSGTFEIKLFETGGCAEVHYSAVSDPNNSHHTIGGVAETDVDGMSYFDTTPGSTISTMAVRYCQTTTPPPRCSPATQTGAPGPFSFTATRGQPPLSWSAPGGAPPAQAPATPGNSFSTTYANAGTYTVTVTDSAGNFRDCTVTVVLPGCGYTVDNVWTYDFVDLWATGGTPATGGATWDDGYEAHPLNDGVGPAFEFELCGVRYDTVNLSSNGYVCFDTSNWCGDYPGQALPDPWAPLSAVFGYWSDLYPPGCGGSACVRYQALGTAPYRVFVYEQQDVPFYCCSPPPALTHEIKLFETTNCIEVHYKDVQGDGNSFHTVTSGYQDATGTAGYMYAFAGPGWVRAATAWRACPFGAASDAVTFNEDQPAQSFNVTANDNGAGSPLTIIAHTNPTKGALTVPASGPDGVVTYQPFPDAVGADSFEYTIEGEPGMTATGHVEITINPVNDPPRFTAGSEPIHWAPTYGPYAAPGWATGVAPGPAAALDEEGQAVFFDRVSVSNPSLFLTLPTLERSGSPSSPTPTDPPVAGAFAVLRYEPSGASGSSTVCFQARDDGGTATVTTSGLAPPRSDTGVDTADPPQCAVIFHNNPPLAHYESSTDQAQPGQAIAFDSCPGALPYRCSHDPDGAIVRYAWDFGDGTSSAHPSPIHTFPAPGRYLVRLTITDDAGLTATIVRSYAVGWPGSPPVGQEGSGAPTAPIADAGPDLDALEGDTVAVAGAARGASEHARYEWTQAGGPAVQVEDPTAATLRFQAPAAPAGTPVQLAFSLRVVEGALASAPDHVVVTVHGRNHAPEAAAGGTLVAAVGAEVTLDAGASRDPDGDELAFAWEQVEGPAVALSGADRERATFTAPGQPVQLAFRLRASDGEAAGTDVAVVHVQPAEAAPAGVAIGYEILPTPAGADVEFTAVGALDAAWDFGDGSPPASGRTVVHHYAAGAYEATMTVGGQSYAQRIDVEGKAREPVGQPATASPLPWLLAGAVGLLVAAAAVAIVLRRTRSA